MTESKRNYSLDLLRLIAMFMVVCLHILNHGEVMSIANGKVYYILMGLRNLCIVAVNLYVMISGYFLVTQKFRPSKLIRLYIEVIFWGLAGFIFGIISGTTEFSVKTLIFGVMFPFSSGYYWFVSAYVILYLLSPILNFIIKKLTRKQHLAVCLGLLFFFSLWKDVFIFWNVFNMDDGYSFGWFIVLYFVGSYLRLHADPKKWKLSWVWYFVIAAFMTAVATVATLLPGDAEAVVVSVFDRITQYNSILVTLAAMFLFVTFLKFEIKGKVPQKIIGLVAPAALGVYLIHDNRYVRDYLWQNIVKTQNFDGNSIVTVLLTVGWAALVFVACLALSFVIKLIFSLWEKRKFWRNGLANIDKFVVGTLYKVTDRILEGKKE